MPQRLISDTEFFDFKTNQYVQRLIASPVLNQGRRSSNSRSGLFEKILEMLDRHDLVEFVDKVNETHTEKIVWTPLTYTSDLANQISRLMDQQTREQSRVWLKVLMDKVSVPEPIGVSLFQQRLSQLEAWLGLSHAQVELICFVFLYSRKHGLMDTISSFNAFNYESLYKNLPVVLGITEEESNELMSVDSVLARAGIVNGQRTFRTVEISETISEFLSGWRSGDIVDSMFDCITKPPYMELADFSLKPLQRDILLALLSQKDRSVNILLHGESGTGKTTLAACLGQHLGVPVFGVRSENQQDPQQRMEQVALAATMFREQNVILVVDEADTLLAANPSFKGKGSIQKSYLNSFLESLSVKIIWISNDVTELPKSSVRRFDYILGFSGLPRAARINAWKKAIDANLETTCIDSAEIEQLADRWRLSPGAVTRSVQNLATMGTEAGPVSILNELLRGYEELLNEPRVPSLPPSSTPYHPLVLDVSGQLESSIESARAFLANGSEGDSMSVLLHGPSGSGKTRFAHYMAEQLARRIIVRKAADFVIPIPGMSEKIMAAIFKEAEDEESILFIDDCDLLFSMSGKSAQQWEVSLLNAFMRQMELFRGLVICAATGIAAINRAALRHWHHKVEFKELSEDGKVCFFTIMLKPLITGRLHIQDVTKAMQGLQHLTVGDFESVRRRFVHSREVTQEMILNALAEENDLKYTPPSRIGF